MGAECVSKDTNLYTEILDERGNSINNFNTNNNQYIIEYNFNFKNYREYFVMIQILKEKIKEILGKLASLSHFTPVAKLKEDSEFDYYEYLTNISIDNLGNTALNIFHKIGAIYGENNPFPKEELSKVTFSLIAKYKAYESQVDEEFSGKFVVDKIIRRINFFTEEFPYKLKNLDKIILSKKIFCFGFDRNMRLNIFMEPEVQSTFTKFSSQNPNSLYKERANNELKEEFFYFEKENNGIIKETFKINHSDYLTYIYFIVEIVLPILKDRYNFSMIINLFINFNGNEADTEFISYLMNDLNKYYPFGLGKVHIVNFQVEKLIPNKSFRKEVGEFDIFRNLVFHNESFQFQLVKDININYLPIKYGGYHSLDGYDLPPSPNLNDFINYTLSMILIN